MTEKVSENRVCPNCRRTARPGAGFCHHCGVSLAPVAPAAGGERFQTDNLNDSAARRDGGGINSKNANDNSRAARSGIGGSAIQKPLEGLFEQSSERKPPLVREKTLVAEREAKLNTTAAAAHAATAVRPKKGAATVETQKTEVVWEAAESTANVWFLLASLLLVLFAVGILLAMLYIR